ncbi:MAG: Asp-tRNA(Asn)/Glu-tRNA(Gln) amidotransferase subunit GatA, partial [Oscillospiraceae bacterium]|nr:Asp-tRNA(Asn)/Glu-tRNA(Gln) amidotransferase subunit GatA [Oscillospiraceae bacterium]
TGETLHPLEGIPVCIKDNILTEGIKTTCGSKMLESYMPVFDSHVWELLRAQGTVLMGKGNMDELAMGSTGETSFFGGVVNPINTSCVAGGSSGGPAAAVAVGQAVYALGSDTGGSVRLPAAFCGCVGLKPSYGAVSRRGLIAYASSFDQIGPIASCVEDAAAVLDVITQPDPMDMTHRGLSTVSDALDGNVKGMKIGIADEFLRKLSPAVEKAVADAIDTYRSMGAELVKVSFPMLRYCLPAYYIIACAEASSNLGRYDGIRFGHRSESFENLDDMICRSRSEGFGAEVRRRILLGTYVLREGYYDRYYKKAQVVRQRVTTDFQELFERCDCLLTPTAPVTAARLDSGMSSVEMYQTDICTVPANLAGLPAISVPCGGDSEGLPAGLQLMSRRFNDTTVINAALAFERFTGGKFIPESKMGVRL